MITLDGKARINVMYIYGHAQYTPTQSNGTTSNRIGRWATELSYCLLDMLNYTNKTATDRVMEAMPELE